MDLNRYIGIPYRDHGRDRDGLDCWGLVDLIYREVRGITLPDYRRFYADADDAPGVAALLGMAALGQVQVGGWKPVPAGEERPLDVLLLRLGHLACHTALLAGGGDFLHVMRGRSTALERLDSFVWQGAARGAFRWTA